MHGSVACPFPDFFCDFVLRLLKSLDITFLFTVLFRYIKRILGDEDNKRPFNKRGRWGRGKGFRGRERGRGGDQHQQRGEGGPWKNRRGKRQDSRGGRNDSDSITVDRDSASTASSLSESPIKSEAREEVDHTEHELKNDLNDSVMNAIMADIATASSGTVGNSQCPEIQEGKTKKEDTSKQVSPDSGVASVSLDLERQRTCNGRGSRAAGSRKRKEMERGCSKWTSRREANKPKRKKVTEHSLLD